MVAVRPLRADEWRAWKEMRLRMLRTDPGAYGTTYAEAVAFADARWQERAAGSADFRTFVAEEDGVLLATATGFRAEDDPEAADVVAVWTAPEARRRGLSRLVIEAVLDWARGAGMTTARLWVVEANADAASVYAGLGFRPTGNRQPYPNDPTVTELEMALDL